MAVDTALQTQWEAFLKLVQVREPRLFEHLKSARPKEMTKYNLVLLAENPEDLREIEVGMRVYHDKIDEFSLSIFGHSRGIKTELASEEDWNAAEPRAGSSPQAAQAGGGGTPTLNVSADQNELLKVLEASIRQKVEAEVRDSLLREMASGEAANPVLQKLKEDFEHEEENRRLAVRMTLLAEGDKALTQLVMAWQHAKQTGEGGQHWQEVKQRILELLDAAVQLTQS